MIEVAGLLVQNNRREILLVQKQGFWFFLGGKREGNENLDTTLRRESKEELSLRLPSLPMSPEKIHKGEFKVINSETYLIHTFFYRRRVIRGRCKLNPNDSVKAYIWTKSPFDLNLTEHARFILESFL